jgi:hypothetical protein
MASLAALGELGLSLIVMKKLPKEARLNLLAIIHHDWNGITQKLDQMSEIDALASSKEEEQEDQRKRKISEEKFLAFASKCYPEHPGYAEHIEVQKIKKQKNGEKNVFNSPRIRRIPRIKTKKHIITD